MKLDDKGQGSIELLFVTIIIFIMIGGMISMVNYETDLNQTADIGKARITGEMLAKTINTAYINGNNVNGNNYSANINIPADIDFTASITPGSITVLSNNQNISIKIIPYNVTDYTMTSGHTYTVSNVNGIISFTQL